MTLTEEEIKQRRVTAAIFGEKCRNCAGVGKCECSICLGFCTVCEGVGYICRESESDDD